MRASLARTTLLTSKPADWEPAQPHIAYVLALLQDKERCVYGMEEAWFSICYRLVERIELVSANTALLDLGVCREDEAHAALRDLQQRLAQRGYVVSVGIGASCVLAQLALLTIDKRLKKQGIIRTIAPAVVSAIPTRILPLIHPHGAITSAVVERLQRYGLRTLGHIARLTEAQLRRQFGDTTGAALFALAQGRDLRPLMPTPPLRRVTLRFRLSVPLAPARLLALAPTFCAPLAAQLQQHDQCAGGLSVQVRWEHGARTTARVTLRQPTGEASLLSAALRSLLTPLMPSEQLYADADAVDTVDAVDGLWITLEDVALLCPAQLALWQEREARLRRRATLQTVAATLAQRHHRPLLAQAQLATPDAIFAEDRYTLRGLEMLTAPAPARTTTPRKRVAEQTTDADAVWRDVPQRLHWW